MNNSKKYKLAVVPKVQWYNQYAYAYGSQHDYFHTKACLKVVSKELDIEFKIIYLKSFLKKHSEFDGVIFIGLSKEAMQFIKLDQKIDKYTWSFNQIEWINNRDIFKNTKIIFEQSTRDLSSYYHNNNIVYYTPLGFQGDKRIPKNKRIRYDIVFNGTLDRSRRLTATEHRKDIILGLLKKGHTIINFNGRADKSVEKKLLDELKKYKNFKVVNKFGNPKHYTVGKYSLHLPFHELGSNGGIYLNWGMTRKELEDSNWLNNWDIYRCIGAKSNIITFDCPEIKHLGLSENNCSFYKNDPSNIEGIVKEVSEIVNSNVQKKISNSVWKQNTYIERWKFILSKISEIKDLSK